MSRQTLDLSMLTVAPRRALHAFTLPAHAYDLLRARGGVIAITVSPDGQPSTHPDKGHCPNEWREPLHTTWAWRLAEHYLGHRSRNGGGTSGGRMFVHCRSNVTVVSYKDDRSASAELFLLTPAVGHQRPYVTIAPSDPALPARTRRR